MKHLFAITWIISSLITQPRAAEPAPGQPNPPSPLRLPPPGVAPFPKPKEESPLTRFDLDFPGGTPELLVEAIQQTTRKPLNAIVAEDSVNELLPALKMKNINVAELFETLGLATSKSVSYSSGGGYSIYTSSATFKTQGPPSPESIWYFRADKPPLVLPKAPQTICRFYQLGAFLERQTVEDITTAVETGWQMLGDPNPKPTLKFHKETKLLIAVGTPDKLQLIDDVLRQLKDAGGEPRASDVKKR